MLYVAHLRVFFWVCLFSFFITSMTWSESLSCSDYQQQNMLYEHTECLLQQGDTKNAYLGIQQLIDEEDYEESLSFLDLIPVGQQILPNHNILKATALFRSGDLNRAKDVHSSELQSIKNLDVLVQRAQIYIQLNALGQAEKVIQSLPLEDNRTDYLKGVFLHRQGNLDGAIRSLRKITPSSSFYVDSQLLIADSCFKMRRFSCSEHIYLALKPDEPIYFSHKLDNLNDKRSVVNMTFILGEQYDSNVTSVDENETGVSEESSMRTFVLANLGAIYTFASDVSISAELDNYAGWNHSVSDYDTRVHSIGLGVKKKFDGFDIQMPKVVYEHIAVDDSPYLNTLKIQTALDLYFHQFVFSFPFSYELKYFQKDPYRDERDSDVYRAGIDMRFTHRNKLVGQLRTAYGDENAEDSIYDNTAMSAEVSLTYQLFQKVLVGGKYKYELFDYRQSRKDYHHSMTAFASYYINSALSVSGDVSRIDHQSSQRVHQYDKYVYSLFMKYTY